MTVCDCPTCLGNGVLDDGYPCGDCQVWDDEDELECTWCGGDGECMDGTDPLGNCPDDPHRCHACNGSGLRRDQRVF